MGNRKPAPVGARLERFSTAATRWTGSSHAFALALLIIVAWAIAERGREAK